MGQVRGQMAQLAQAAQQQAAFAHENFQAAVGTPLPPVSGDARQMGHEVVSAQATADYALALQVPAMLPVPLSFPYPHARSIVGFSFASCPPLFGANL